MGSGPPKIWGGGTAHASVPPNSAPSLRPWYTGKSMQLIIKGLIPLEIDAYADENGVQVH